MKLAIVLCSLLLVQYLLTLIQVHCYKKTMNKIVSAYRKEDGYFLFSDMYRKKLGFGAIVMLIVKDDYIIKECYVLHGLSVLPKFKRVEKYTGVHLGELLNRINDGPAQKKASFFMALARKRSAVRFALNKVAERALLAISKSKKTADSELVELKGV